MALSEVPFSTKFETTYKAFLRDGETIRVLLDRENSQEYLLIDRDGRLCITPRIKEVQP